MDIITSADVFALLLTWSLVSLPVAVFLGWLFRK